MITLALSLLLASSPPSSSSSSSPSPRSSLPDPAPRPAADVRVQNRLYHNAKAVHLFVGVDYLERRDYYVSPGVRIGGGYWWTERLGLELQISRFFSRLNDAAREVGRMYGVLPDSRAPSWLVVGGLRAGLGYGKMMVGGLGSAIHFQPQALLQAGLHAHEGNVGPSALGGIGLLVHATDRLFVRLDGAVSLDLEARSAGTVAAFGFLPSLVVGGAL